MELSQRVNWNLPVEIKETDSAHCKPNLDRLRDSNRLIINPTSFSTPYNPVTISTIHYDGVTHELINIRPTSQSPLTYLIWRTAGIYRAEFSPSTATKDHLLLIIEDAVLCQLPKWSGDQPLLAILYCNGKLRFFNLISGDSRYCHIPTDEASSLVQFSNLGVLIGDKRLRNTKPHDAFKQLPVFAILDHVDFPVSIVHHSTATNSGNSKAKEMHRLAQNQLPEHLIIPEDHCLLFVNHNLMVTCSVNLLNIYQVIHQPLTSPIMPFSPWSMTANQNQDNQMNTDQCPENEHVPPILDISSRSRTSHNSTSTIGTVASPLCPISNNNVINQPQSVERSAFLDTHMDQNLHLKNGDLHDISACRISMRLHSSLPVEFKIKRAIFCQSIVGEDCVALLFYNCTFKIIKLTSSGIETIFCRVNIVDIAGIKFMRQPSIVMLADTEGVYQLQIWADQEVPIKIPEFQSYIHSFFTGGTQDNIKLRFGDGDHIQLKLSHPRWDSCFEYMQVLEVLGNVYPPSEYLHLRNHTDFDMNMKDLLSKICSESSISGLLKATVLALFLFLQELLCNVMQSLMVNDLCQVLFPLCTNLGWAQHLEYLIHLRLSELHSLSTDGLKAMTLDPNEPVPSCLVAFATNSSSNSWPSLLDIRRQYIPFLSYAEVVALNNVQDPFPVSTVIVEMIRVLKEYEHTDVVKFQAIEPILLRLFRLWQKSASCIDSLPVGWQMIIKLMIELARQEPHHVDALTPAMCTFLNRQELHSNTVKRPLSLTNSTINRNINQQDLANIRDLLTIPEVVWVTHGFKYLEGPEHKREREYSDAVSWGTSKLYTLPIGLGALDFKSIPLPPQFNPAAPLPTITETTLQFRNLSGMALSLSSPDALVWADRDANMLWPRVHQGVSVSLSAQLPLSMFGNTSEESSAKLIDWLWAHRPSADDRVLSPGYAGWILGFGLQGKLSYTNAEFVLFLLEPKPGQDWKFQDLDACSIIGCAASRIGTNDLHLCRLFPLYLPDMYDLPCSSPTIPPQVQMAAVLGIGMVKAETFDLATGTRFLTVLLSKSQTSSVCVGDVNCGEGVLVSVALALSFLFLGHGNQQMTCKLNSLIRLENPQSSHSAIPGWIALGWTLFNQGKESAPNETAFPHLNEIYLISPRVLFFQIVAKFLIEWDSVCLSSMTEFQLSDTCQSISPGVHLDVVYAAIAYILALKFSGSQDLAIRNFLFSTMDRFTMIMQDPESSFHHMQQKHFAYQWMYLTGLCVSMIMAGSGDEQSHQKLTNLFVRVGPYILNGHHIQASMSMGFLYCGQGRFTLRTTTAQKALALFAATMPYHPQTKNDQTRSLHILPHLWVLALEPSTVVAVCVDSGTSVVVPVELKPPPPVLLHDHVSPCVHLSLPCRIDKVFDKLALHVVDRQWYPVITQVDKLLHCNVGGANDDGGVITLYLQRRAGINVGSMPLNKKQPIHVCQTYVSPPSIQLLIDHLQAQPDHHHEGNLDLYVEFIRSLRIIRSLCPPLCNSLGLDLVPAQINSVWYQLISKAVRMDTWPVGLDMINVIEYLVSEMPAASCIDLCISSEMVGVLFASYNAHCQRKQALFEDRLDSFAQLVSFKDAPLYL